MEKRVGVVLAGCGVFDGSEIHEAVLTLFFLTRAGARAICAAPNMPHYHVLDHLSQELIEGQRNVLSESARIARGDIVDLESLSADQIDAVIIPGGYGAAKNLSNFAITGPQSQVQPDVQRLLNEMLSASKPIGAMCIAPATLTRALAAYHPEVTIGTDTGTAAAIEAMGGIHRDCLVDQIVFDAVHKIVTTPAYMLGTNIAEVAVGIEKLVNKVVELIN